MKYSAAAPVAALAVGVLAFATQAHALVRSTSIMGSMSPTQETCLQGLTNSVGDGENCMYDLGPAADPILTPIGAEVTGPYIHAAYYDSVDTPASFQTTISGSARLVYSPTVGDGKMSQVITGSVSIDDGGDGAGANDLISFNLTLRSSGPGSVVRVYSGSAGVDMYSSMAQVLAPTAAHSVTANGAGGFDYIIGSEGFPDIRTYALAGACLGRPFGFVECAHAFATPSFEPNFWNGSSAAGIGSLENNLGAKTTGTVTGLTCIDGRSVSGVESNDCRDSQVLYSPWVLGPCAVQGGCTLSESTGGVRGAAEDVGWDQLLLKVSTNAAGLVVAVAGFNVDDYRVFNQTRCGDNLAGVGSYLVVCNSWTTGYFTAAAVPAQADADNDNIDDTADNCTLVVNPTQLDADVDGFGNACDADLNNSGQTTSTDYLLLRSVLNKPIAASAIAAAADMNGSGLVTTADFTLLRARLNTAPGPSGLAP